MSKKFVEDEILITSGDKYIVIAVPIDLMVFAANDMPAPCMRVKDKAEFAREIMKRIRTYADSNEVEIGTTHFHQFLDDIIMQVYENGSECIEEAELPLSLTEK